MAKLSEKKRHKPFTSRREWQKIKCMSEKEKKTIRHLIRAE